MTYTVIRVTTTDVERAAELADEESALDVVRAFELEGIPLGTTYEIRGEDDELLWTTASGTLARA